ncbi:Lung surfactant protein D coiled-coil trimerization domain-containing protein [Dioscorea alata]|uniref:Lung surfactant protein D coiled-coil trimerization domain-containing protein n=1 Tax=Dioscorea alata TaxID=55571 RepID=A0ACB7U1Z4_DIOAL|nr:Lung surfactant protein D coiled-coil trimerization domain-containing protein [Dioscorea alata]
MTKKKNTQTKAASAPATRSSDVSMTEKATDSSQDKMENLKTLNSMLLKETREHRGQLADLRSKLDELSIEHGFMSSIEHQVFGVSFTNLLLDAFSRLDAEAWEKVGIEKSLDLKEIKIRELECKIVCLEEQMEGVVMKNRDEVDRIRLELGVLEVEKKEVERRLVEKEHFIAELEVGSNALEKSRREMEVRLGGEIDGLKRRMAEMVNDEEEGSRRFAERELYIKQLDSEKSVLEQEKKGIALKLMAEIDVLGQRLAEKELYLKLVEDEKAEMEMKFRAEIDMAKKRMEEMELYIKQLEGAKSAAEEEKKDVEVHFEWKIQGMLVEIDGLNVRIAEVGREREALERKLAETEADACRLTQSFNSGIDSLKGRIAELEHCVKVLEGERDSAEEEKQGMEIGFELMKQDMVANIEELKQRIVAFGNERQVFERKLAEMDSLRGRVKELELCVKTLEKIRDAVEEEKRDIKEMFESKTQGMVADMNLLNDKIADIGKERDVFERKLAEKEDYARQLERDGEKIAHGLRMQIEELKTTNSVIEENLQELEGMIKNVQLDNEVKNKSVVALTQEKELIERKLKASESKSTRFLTMLRSMEDENVNSDYDDMDEEVRNFAAEMKVIRDSFESRLAKEKAKNDGKLWGWVYPATSTIVAAISLAYAARGR